MNGFLVLLRYDCCDVPVQMFNEQDQFAAVNLARKIADNPCGVQDKYDAAFDALNIRLREWEQVPSYAAVLRITGGVVSEMVDEFYTGADEDTDDDDDECDFD